MTWKNTVLLAAVLAVLAPVAGAVVSLVDASGVQFDINTNVAATTSISASGSAKEVEYTTSVTGVTTSLGATETLLLTNGVDGYAGLLVNGVSYNQNGSVTTSCQGETSLTERQIVFAEQTIDEFTVQRKVFVPDDESFCRWLNIITNTSASDADATLTLVGSLGSGTDTVIGATSTAPVNTVTTSDRWVVTYKDYDGGGHSASPRLGHVLQGPGRRIGPSSATITAGAANIATEYSFTLDAGETFIVMQVLTAKPSIDEAKTQCDAILALPESLLTCLTGTERSEVVNFDLIAPTVAITSATSQTTSQSPIPVTVTFSESVTGFVIGDLVIDNGSASSFSGSGTTYTFNLTPTSSGEVTVDVPEGVAKDGGGNSNTAATQFTRTTDAEAPSVAISSITSNPSSISTVIQVLVTFSEPVTGFTKSDVLITGAQYHSSGPFSGSDAVYTFSLLPVKVSGSVTVTIPDGVCTDDAGNANTGAVYQHGVAAGASCYSGAKAGSTPLQAGLIGLMPLWVAAAGLVALEARSRRKRNRS